MNCPKCGKEAKGKFCPFCGTKLEEAPAAQPGDASGSAPNQTQSYAPNQSYGNPGYSQNQSYANPGYSPNQGYASNQGYAPNQGYAGNQAYTQRQNYNNPSFAYNPSRNPGYIPNQGFNPGQQVMGSYQDVPAEVAGLSPGAQLLRKHARSPLTLIAAILVTLYAGIISYFCGKAGVEAIDRLGGHLYSTEEIRLVVCLVLYVTQIVMAIWLSISVWMLFASAASLGSLKSCRAYLSFRMVAFAVLTLSALIMLIFVITKSRETGDFWYATALLMEYGAYYSGHSAIPILGRGAGEVVLILLMSIPFVLAVVQSMLLSTASASSARMLRYGGPLQKRILPAGVLTLLHGLILLAGNIYLLVENGDYLAFEGILFYCAFLSLGLAEVFMSIVLFMNDSEMKRMRGL